MFGQHFDFNEETMHIVEEIGRHMPGGFFIYKADKPEELLYANPDTCVRIPMRNELRSLNLSNSVAIAVYEALRQWDYPDLSREGRLTQYEW